MSDGDLLGVLLNQIKVFWPQFQITKENLLHPTKDLVFRFYSNFVTEYYEKIAYLTRSAVLDDFNGTDLAPEVQLFLQVSRLLEEINSLTFTWLDIYQPTQKGTKSFFMVCIHFIQFVDQLTDEIDALGNDVFKIKEETDKLLSELSELLQEINENAKTKGEMLEANKNTLEQKYTSVKNAHKDMLAMRATKEKLHAEKKIQIERLKRELQNEELEMNRLESRKKEQLEQRITEGEYENILRSLEILKTDSEMLESDDVNMEDGLLLENETLVHTDNCNRVLSKYDFNLQEVNALINKEGELKTVLNTIEKLQTNQLELKQQTLEHEQNLVGIKESFSTLQRDYKELKENYISNLEQFSTELVIIRDDIEGKCQSNIRTISEYNEAIMKLEGDMEKLRNGFKDEYIRVSKVEKRVMDKYRNILMKYGKSE